MYVEIPYLTPSEQRMVTLTLLGSDDLIGWVSPNDLDKNLIRVHLPQKVRKDTPLNDPNATSKFGYLGEGGINETEKINYLNDWLNPRFIRENILDPYPGSVLINQKHITSVIVWTYALARFYCHQQLIVSGSENKDAIIGYLRAIRAREWLLDPWRDWQTIPARDLFAEQEIVAMKEIITTKPFKSFFYDGVSSPWKNPALPAWIYERVCGAGYLGKRFLLTMEELAAHHEPRYSVAHSLEWRYYRFMKPCGAFAKDFLPPKDEPRLFGELMAPTHGEILATKSKAAPYRILWAILTYQGTPKQVRFYTPPNGGAYGEYTQCELIYVAHGRLCTLSAFVHHARVKQAQGESEKWLSLTPEERLQNQGSFLYWVLANPSAPGHTEALEKHPNPLVV